MLGKLKQHTPKAINLPITYSKDSKIDFFPKISIVTPVLNNEKFIEKTIKSVLSQNYPNLEYVLQDGGSSDNTLKIISRYLSQVSKFSSIPDKGQTEAINSGFLKTTGQLMAWLNSDDVLLPGTLVSVANFFNLHPEIDVLYGHRLLIDENDMQIGQWILPNHNENVITWIDYIPQETMFWRRSIWDKCGGRLDESFNYAMDWDLILRFKKVGAKFVRIPRFLGAFRVHQQQKTTLLLDQGHQEIDKIRKRELGYSPTVDEINAAVSSYLTRHIIEHHLFSIKLKMLLLWEKTFTSPKRATDQQRY